MFSRKATAALVCLGLLILITPLLAQRSRLIPSWNLFSTQQDVEIGTVLAQDAEATLTWSRETFAQDYIDALGNQLGDFSAGYKYPYEFRVFRDPSIQSFALPGGIIYLSSGLVLATQNEAQLAGVLAHQIGHVVARHGSQQLSDAYASRRTERLTNVSAEEVLSRLNVAVTPGSVLFRYSSQAEQEADTIAVQLLYDAGFDPQAIVSGMQRLSAQPVDLKGDFFRDHPAPSNRAAAIRREAQRLGPISAAGHEESADFRATQANLRAEGAPSSNRRGIARSELPSSRFVIYEGYDFDIDYPDNWTITKAGSAVTLSPENGIVSGALAYGMLTDAFRPRSSDPFGRSSFTVPGQSGRRTITLSAATDQLLEELRRNNPNLRIVRKRQKQIADLEALEVEMTNESPIGGLEVNRLVTVLRGNDGLSYFLAVAPETEANRYRATFDRMFSSIRFYN
jgi:beta-barrel assembly-enhancing protease